MSSFADCFVVPTVLVRTTWFLTGVAVVPPPTRTFLYREGKARAVLVSWTTDVMCTGQSRNLVLFHPLGVKRKGFGVSRVMRVWA